MAIQNIYIKETTLISQETENVTVPTLPPEVIFLIVQQLDQLGIQLMMKVSHVWKEQCLYHAKKLEIFPLTNMFSFLSLNLENLSYDSAIEGEIESLDNLLAIRNKTDIFKEKLLGEMKKLSQDEFSKLKLQARQNSQIFSIFEDFEKLLALYKRLDEATTSEALSGIVNEMLATHHLHHKAKQITESISDPEIKIAAQEKVFCTFMENTNFCQALAVVNEMPNCTPKQPQVLILLIRKLILHVSKKLADTFIETTISPAAIRQEVACDLIINRFVKEGIEVASDIPALPENALLFCLIVEALLKIEAVDEADHFIMHASWDNTTKSNLLALLFGYYYERKEFEQMFQIVGKLPDIAIQSKVLENLAAEGIFPPSLTNHYKILTIS